MQIDFNSIIVKIDNGFHMFILEGSNISTLSSIPITDHENVYSWLKDSQIAFVRTRFLSMEGEDVDITQCDLENIQYSIRDRFSVTVFDKENNETSVEQLMKEGSLNDVVKNVVEEKILEKSSL